MMGARIMLAVTVLVVTASLARLAGRKDLDIDEIEHAHAAWLVYQGAHPYQDFFEHHPPFYWQFLRGYYEVFGPQAGVFAWGRTWMILAFLGSVYVLYRLGHELFGFYGGIGAGALLVMEPQVYFPAVMMRPDGGMILLVLAGILLFIRGWRRTFSARQAALAGLLMGLAFAVHPRAGFTVVALALTVAFDVGARSGWRLVMNRRKSLLIFAVVFLIPPAAPFLIYGFHTYEFHVYKINTALQPVFPPWNLMKALLLDPLLLPLLLAGLVGCLWRICRRPRRGTAEMAALLFFLLNALGVAAARRPFIQVFYVFIPFVALVAGRGVVCLTDRLAPRPAALAVGVLLAVGLARNPCWSYWKWPDEWSPRLARLARLNDLIPPGERYAGTLDHHPVFRPDGTRYWLDMDMRTVAAITPDYRHDFVEEFRKSRPLVVDPDVMLRFAYDVKALAGMDAYLTEHYRPIPGEAPLLMRK